MGWLGVVHEAIYGWRMLAYGKAKKGVGVFGRFRRAGGLRPYERIPCPALMQQVSMILAGVAWGACSVKGAAFSRYRKPGPH